MTAAPFVGVEIAKPKGEVLRVSLDEYKGKPILDVRVWYQARDGDMRPSKTGVTTAAWNLPAVKRGIDAVFAEAVRRGLVEPGHLSPETGKPESTDRAAP